jgi:uncharacterized protein YeaO (DUF488 family)
MFQTKRAYVTASAEDGYRILVDRLWPRGLTKEKLKIDWWPKDIAPSTEIRKEFHHEQGKFADFINKYHEELDQNPFTNEFIEKIRELLKSQTVTFVYGAKSETINHAIVLKEYVEKKL